LTERAAPFSLNRQRLIELLARDRAMAKQDFAEARALAECVEDRVQLALGHDFLVDEDLSERDAFILLLLPRERGGQLGGVDQPLLNQ
jgi:hypothetical protein